jgi:transcriptional regulator GlxA family with amidase domain
LLTQISKKKKNCTESGMMRRVTENMEHCFGMKYDVKAFAQMLNISESPFNHLFKEYIGVSPYTYFINLRIENAANLLESTDMKIKDVAIRCGFEDALYFTQAFKRIKGETPSKYRSHIKIS